MKAGFVYHGIRMRVRQNPDGPGRFYRPSCSCGWKGDEITTGKRGARGVAFRVYAKHYDEAMARKETAA